MTDRKAILIFPFSMKALTFECVWCKDEKYHSNSIPHVAWDEFHGSKVRIEWW
jgi:hypothetical protein